jgi:uncharacterized membrane protein
LLPPSTILVVLIYFTFKVFAFERIPLLHVRRHLFEAPSSVRQVCSTRSNTMVCSVLRSHRSKLSLIVACKFQFDHKIVCLRVALHSELVAYRSNQSGSGALLSFCKKRSRVRFVARFVYQFRTFATLISLLLFTPLLSPFLFGLTLPLDRFVLISFAIQPVRPCPCPSLCLHASLYLCSTFFRLPLLCCPFSTLCQFEAFVAISIRNTL